MKSPYMLLCLIFVILIGSGFPIPGSAEPDAICTNVTEIPTIECEALVALYNSTNGANWYNNTNWLVTNTPSNWYGVTVVYGHVEYLNLYSNNLVGTMPLELGNLSFLISIILTGNELTGNIPSELGNLPYLRMIDLYGNHLSGSIPAALGNLDLWELVLGSNDLTGSIPPELGNLSNLTSLYLHYNDLTGSIPITLGNLAALRNLYLGSNDLTGNIPSELGNLSSLTSLDLHSNQLTGGIPATLSNLTALSQLDLSSNLLNGSIPATLGNLTALTRLYLDDNQLTGEIPSELGNLTALRYLYLRDTQLSGSIPLSFINLSLLDYFYFNNTLLCEPTTPEYIAWKDTVLYYVGTGDICDQNMHVCDLEGSSVRVSKPKWNATVTISIHDQVDEPVLGATVMGNWSNGSSDECTTEADGICSITLQNLVNKITKLTFTVTDVSAESYVYMPAENHDLDGDSDGTVIVIKRPK